MRSQKKETKEYPQGASPISLSAEALSRLRKATPSRLFPVLLSFMGGNRKLAIAQTADHRIPHEPCAARRGTKGILKPVVFEVF